MYKKSSIPAVIAPLSGHSYNPQEQDIQEIIEKVVEHEGPQQQQIKEKKQKPIRNVVPRARNKNRRLEQLQAKQRREQRSLNNSIHNLKHLQRL